MGVQSEIRLVSEGLADGQTYRGDCPSCGRSNTFTCTRTGPSVVYNCYSAHCTLHGAIGSGSASSLSWRTIGDTNKHHAKDKHRSPSGGGRYTGELLPLSEREREVLRDKVGFVEWHVERSGVLYAPREDRFAYPIYNPCGGRRGFILRSYNTTNDRLPKALTRLDIEGPHTSWYQANSGATNRALVCEDIPSTVRAARYYPLCVALSGSAPSTESVKELSGNGVKRIIWALDADATATSIRLCRKYQLTFEDSRVLVLPKDLKNMQEEELHEFLKEGGLVV